MINLHDIKSGRVISDIVKAVAYAFPRELFLYKGEEDRFYSIGFDGVRKSHPDLLLISNWVRKLDAWISNGKPEPINVETE